MLFSLYTAPFAGVTSSFGVSHAQCADDTQLYIGLSDDHSLTALNKCFVAARRWLAVHGLSLNASKSEAMVVDTGDRHRQQGKIGTILLGDTSIETATQVRSLGVTLDSTMSFDKQVDGI